MGGCVVSYFRSQNDKSIVDNQAIINYRKGRPYNVITAPPGDGCSATYRYRDEAKKSEEEFFNANYNGNLYDSLKAVVKKHPKRDAIGIRPIDHIEKTTITGDGGKEKPWEYIHLKPTIKWTFSELFGKMEAFGRGLRDIGVAKGSRVAIYEDTRAEWLVGCYGLWSQGMIGVTVYATLGEQALEYALKEAEVSTIITNGRFVQKLIDIGKRAGTVIPNIIFCDEIPNETSNANANSSDNGGQKKKQTEKDSEKTPYRPQAEGVNLYTFDEVLERGNKIAPETFPAVSPQPNDHALIMYTSGTAGDPKGVIMSHGNIFAAVACITPRLFLFLSPKESCTYIAYLPLAHILEFAGENAMLLKGFFVGYGSPRTLTDTTAKPHGDLKEFKPHLLGGVPRVYDTVRKAIEAKIPPGLKKRLFEACYEDRRKYLLEGKDTPYFNEKVFSNVKETLGGNIKVILTGGAPISAKTQEFMRVVTGAEVVQGYGLTETCAIAAVQMPGDTDLETNGPIMAGTELKLRDVDEWKHTDKPNPRGEILLRGPCIAQGYFKQPAVTAEAFLPGGWFATGDVGEIDAATGVLTLIGRVKALVKNAFGEYIALDTLESIYVLNDLVMPNGVCVLVDSHKAYICALILADEAKTMRFAKANNISGTWPTILDNPKFHIEAAKSLAATARMQSRKPFECVRHVRVIADEWTPENGVYTAAFKLKRRIIEARYKNIIDELFKEE